MKRGIYLKKSLAVVLILIINIAVTGCGSDNSKSSKTKEENKTSFFEKIFTEKDKNELSNSEENNPEQTTSQQSDKTADSLWAGTWVCDNKTMVISGSLESGFHVNLDTKGSGDFNISVMSNDIDGNNIHSMMHDDSCDYFADYYFTLNGDTIEFLSLFSNSLGEEQTPPPDSGTYIKK